MSKKKKDVKLYTSVPYPSTPVKEVSPKPPVKLYVVPAMTFFLSRETDPDELLEEAVEYVKDDLAETEIIEVTEDFDFAEYLKANFNNVMSDYGCYDGGDPSILDQLGNEAEEIDCIDIDPYMGTVSPEDYINFRKSQKEALGDKANLDSVTDDDDIVIIKGKKFKLVPAD